MSSTDLNNEDYFSDHPKRLPSFDDLFRAQAQLSPERFFRNMEEQSGESHCSQDDFQRAVVQAAAILAADDFTPDSFPRCRLNRTFCLSGAS
jgi:hypothetical protein